MELGNLLLVALAIISYVIFFYRYVNHIVLSKKPKGDFGYVIFFTVSIILIIITIAYIVCYLNQFKVNM